MYVYVPYNIHFIRDEDCKADDDKLIVSPYLQCGELVFSVEFKVSKSGDSKQRYVFHSVRMTKMELKNYISLLLNLTILDESPYKAYQFDIPLSPSIYVNHTNLPKIQNNILNYLETLLDNWPIRTFGNNITYSNENNQTNQVLQYNSHKFFDEDGNTIYNE